VKIALMMRAMDQDSGFRAYVDRLVETMLHTDDTNTYLLLYRTPKWFGRFSKFKNADEVLLKSPNKFMWDQIAVPLKAWSEKADIIYNPKFSVPLLSHCPAVMGLQEPAWWVWPEHYERLDVLYQRVMLPIYCRKSRHFLSWSKFNIDETKKYIGLSFENTSIASPAPNQYFRPIEDENVLEDFSRKYKLPEKFILSVTRVDHPGLDKSNSFHSGKNVDTTLKAFILARNKIPHHLVIAGRRVREYLLHNGFKESDFERVHLVGFIPHEELPKLFNLADLFVMPSFYEGFGLTLLEGIACGCPAVVSTTGACPEVGQGAVLLADPYDPDDFSEKISSVINNNDLREKLKSEGLKRAADFSWDTAAKITLEVLKKVVED
jgi:glycosyltransferase involved in cell wall biosynthesis